MAALLASVLSGCWLESDRQPSQIISGSVTGLEGSGLTLSLNGDEVLVIRANGEFSFQNKVPRGANYEVEITHTPTPVQQCEVRNGAGIVANVDVIDVQVVCRAQISVLAGTLGGPGSIDGDRLTARFDGISDVVMDASGNLFVADRQNHAIRRITPGGEVSTFAGRMREPGSIDGVGPEARFRNPAGITTDGTDLIVADTDNHTIRRVTRHGTVTTIAGLAGVPGITSGNGAAARFSAPRGIAADVLGNIYVADAGNKALRHIDAARNVVTWPSPRTAAYSPQDVAINTDGGILVTDAGNGLVYRVTATSITEFAFPNSASARICAWPPYQRTFCSPVAIAVSPSGRIYLGEYGNNSVSAWDLSTGILYRAPVGLPQGMVADATDNVYVADVSNSSILKKISPIGETSIVVGQLPGNGYIDGSGATARFNLPLGLTVDSSGTAYVADYDNHAIRKITSEGVTTTYAGGSWGSEDGPRLTARFGGPSGVAADRAGNVYVADQGNATIRRIGADGVVVTLAGMTGTTGSEDGIGAAARFFAPRDIAVDANGNLFVTDPANHNIRRITPDGTVTTIAGIAGTSGFDDGPALSATFSYPDGIAVDNMGNVYVADGGNSAIRRVSAAGMVTTLPGLTGQMTPFAHPLDIAVDSDGSIYVCDTGNSVVRRIAPDGQIATVAGSLTLLGARPGPLPGSLSYPRSIEVTREPVPVLYVISEHAVLKIVLP